MTHVARRGFTLLELLAVMVIISLMSALLVMSVRGHLLQAKLVQTVERIASLDRRAREQARRSGLPQSLWFDRTRGEISLVATAAPDAAASGHVYKLPRGITLAGFRVGRRQTLRQSVFVTFSPLGQSSTYAVRLTASNQATRWLTTLGMTGQQIESVNERDTDAIFAH